MQTTPSYIYIPPSSTSDLEVGVFAADPQAAHPDAQNEPPSPVALSHLHAPSASGSHVATLHTRHTRRQRKSASSVSTKRTVTPKRPSLQLSPVWKTVLIFVLVAQAGVAVLFFLYSLRSELDNVAQRNKAAHALVTDNYADSMEGVMTSLQGQVRQWSRVVPFISSHEEFVRAFNVPGLDTQVTYAQVVRHADRAEFEREAYDDVSAFLNSTAVSRNITSYQFVNGSFAGFATSPVQPDYYPIRYSMPPFLPDVYLTDIGSEPYRRGAVDAVLESPDDVVLTAPGVVARSSGLAFSIVSEAVKSPTNASHVVGAIGNFFVWVVVLPARLSFRPSGPVHVRVYDVTADYAGQLGCKYTMLFGGHHAASGEWSGLADANVLVCPEASSTDELVPSGALSRSVSALGRELLVVVEKDAGFDEKLNESEFIVSSVFLFVLIVMVVVVVLNGWIVVRHVKEAAKASELYMTDLSKAEEHAREAAEHRDQFLAFLSHELRNPLFGLEGTIGEGMQQLDLCTSEEARGELAESFATLHECSLQIERTLNTVVNVQNMATGAIELRSEPFRVSTALKELRLQFAGAAEAKNVRLRFSQDQGVPECVCGDKQRVMEVLAHLLRNALEHTRAGSTVSFRVELGETWSVKDPRKKQQGRKSSTVVPVRNSYEHSYTTTPLSATPLPADSRLSSGDDESTVMVCFMVRDQGPGMTRKQMKRAFQPYTRERIAGASIGRGSDLGLPVSQLLCEQMGGYVRVRSSVGKGCEFTAAMQLCDEDPYAGELAVPMDCVSGDSPVPKAVADSASDASRVPSQRSVQMETASPMHADEMDEFTGRLLVVDDQRVNRRLVSRLLGSVLPAATVEMAEDGQEAVEMVCQAATEAVPFHCVFMDIQMPNMTGTEATVELRKEGFTLPIIAVTGGTLEEEVASYLACGMVDVIHKPCKKSDFVAKLKKHWKVIAGS